MSVPSTSSLEDLLSACNLPWMLHRFSPKAAESIAFIQRLLDRTTEAAHLRLNRDAPDLNEETLIAAHAQNPHKIVAFLQAIATTQNPDLLVMTWRLLQGAEIRALDMTYRMSENFHLRIELSPGRGDHPDVYESSDIVDAALLRHLGITKVNGQPLFDGFYALRLGTS